MWTFFAIAVGGTLGCWARFAQTQLVQAVYGRDFPYATMSINVIGSFVMGFLFVETLERLTLPPALRTTGNGKDGFSCGFSATMPKSISPRNIPNFGLAVGRSGTNH